MKLIYNIDTCLLVLLHVFYISKDMVHIADTKVARRYGDFFIRQIHKFEEVRKMFMLKVFMV